VREEYAEEEAEAAEIEAAENTAALDVAFSLRITKELDAQLRQRAAAEQLPPSALVRRLLRDALRGAVAPVLTVEQVEQIARRVMRETA
jgi:predicted HicB family RNase H-like nuclease